jgi:hypothetical protein
MMPRAEWGASLSTHVFSLSPFCFHRSCITLPQLQIACCFNLGEVHLISEDKWVLPSRRLQSVMTELGTVKLPCTKTHFQSAAPPPPALESARVETVWLQAAVTPCCRQLIVCCACRCVVLFTKWLGEVLPRHERFCVCLQCSYLHVTECGLRGGGSYVKSGVSHETLKMNWIWKREIGTEYSAWPTISKS